jgi:pyruvate dehydrogenase E2 component (dihydrolipoamide acetyltransferase)
MATFEFKLPDIGEGIVEGEIVKWLVKEGDAVAEDQPLVEVMTDKATVTIPSPKRGKVLKCHGNEGQMAKVHHALVTLELEGGASANANASSGASSHAPAHSEPKGAPAMAAASPSASAPSQSEGERVLATPVTRRMAREHGLNLASISGSGPQGRVTKSDVLRALSGNGATAKGPQLSAQHPPTPQIAKSAPLAPVAGDERVPLKGLRKRIAEKMVKSKTLMPHFTFVEEVDCGALIELRSRINAQLKATGDKNKLSFLPFICKALIAALRKYPTLNANFDEATQELVVKHTYNLGVAVATDDGLIVPVVKAVEQKSLRALSVEVEELAAAARNRRSKPEDLSGGTFTITSLGQTGGLFATPIINHPEVAILGVHKMRERPVVKNGQIVVATQMYVSLSFDHRVIDGAVGAAFTYELIRYLEHPELFFLELA